MKVPVHPRAIIIIPPRREVAPRSSPGKMRAHHCYVFNGEEKNGNSLSGGKPLNVRQEFESVVNCGIIEQFFMGKAPPYARGRVFENKNSIHKNRNYY